MDARTDPIYLRLYQDYAAAIREFENATRDRREVRNRLTVRRQAVLHILDDWMRRPVGAPLDARISAREPEPQRPPPPPPEPRRIYLGPILGWAKIIPTTSPPIEPDPLVEVDWDKLFDETSLHMYWRVKSHYEKCKRAFFDYVRKQNIDVHKDRARQALAHGANLQMLGVGGDDDADFLKEARAEVEAACRNAWALYQSEGSQKSDDAKVLLLESLTDSQFVDLESETTTAMVQELDRLRQSGQLGR